MSNFYKYNTSSAYKLDWDFETKRQTENEQLHTRERKTEKKNISRTRGFKLAGLIRVAFCFAVAFLIVNGYVKINEAYNGIAKLEKEYNDIIATNQDLQVKIDKAVDLEQLQNVANEKFGMVRPERYQMFYVDMQQGDFAKTYAREEKSDTKVAMKGVTGTITSAMNIFK